MNQGLVSSEETALNVKYGTQQLALDLFTTKNAVGAITYVTCLKNLVGVMSGVLDGCVICDKVSISSYGESD